MQPYSISFWWHFTLSPLFFYSLIRCWHISKICNDAKCKMYSHFILVATNNLEMLLVSRTQNKWIYGGEREKESKNGWDIRKPDRNVKNVKGACMSGLNNADSRNYSLFVRINQEENVLIAPIIVVISSCHLLHTSFVRFTMYIAFP